MIRTLYYSALRNVRLRRIARAIRSHLSRGGALARRCWSFLPSLSLWAEQINFPITERFAGIHCRIARVRELGTVKVVGGLTIGGTDDQLDAWLFEEFDPFFYSKLPREEGRNPKPHYGTYLYIGRKKKSNYDDPEGFRIPQ